MATKNIVIKRVPIGDLVVSSKNPRNISETNLDKLIESIKADPDFMNKRPVLVSKVNKKLIVYAGTQRLAACKKLGWTEVPCIVENNIPQRILEYRMLADNTHAGEWDMENLAAGFESELRDDVFTHTDFKMVKINEPKKKVGGPTAEKLYKKLLFQEKEDIDLFYDLLTRLQTEYPDETVSNRLRLFLIAE